MRAIFFARSLAYVRFFLYLCRRFEATLMTHNIRNIWLDYKSEVLFFLVLSACAALSHWLARFIPVDLFDGPITAIQNACTCTVCLFGAILMFVHSEGMRIRKAWGIALLSWGIADAFFLWQTYFMDVPSLNIGADAMTAFELLVANLLGWLLLIYPTEVLRPGWLNWQRTLQQLLPMCALVALDYLLLIDLSPVVALYPMVLFILVITHLHTYRIWCEENYSSMERVDIQWIVRYLLILLVIGLSFLYMYFTDNHARAFTQQWLLLLLFGYSTVEILFRPDPWVVARSNASVRPAQQPFAPYREALATWMETEKPYLNPDLRLIDLQRVLPLNRTYLSQLINTEYGCSFYQFVTRYRIEEAKRLMTEQPDMKVQDIAQQSGFSDRKVFYRTFTRETGSSPSEWMAKCRNL